jgi:hypothetical protein
VHHRYGPLEKSPRVWCRAPSSSDQIIRHPHLGNFLSRSFLISYSRCTWITFGLQEKQQWMK